MTASFVTRCSQRAARSAANICSVANFGKHSPTVMLFFHLSRLSKSSLFDCQLSTETERVYVCVCSGQTVGAGPLARL